MPFTEPVKPTDPIETVRKIARLAQLLLDLRTEYERRQRDDLLDQIKHRVAELQALADSLPIATTPEKVAEPAKKHE